MQNRFACFSDLEVSVLKNLLYDSLDVLSSTICHQRSIYGKNSKFMKPVEERLDVVNSLLVELKSI